VKALIEKQMYIFDKNYYCSTAIRKTRMDEADDYLGVENQDFTFDDLEIKMDWIETCLLEKPSPELMMHLSI
jgi:hypothetical protein